MIAFITVLTLLVLSLSEKRSLDPVLQSSPGRNNHAKRLVASRIPSAQPTAAPTLDSATNPSASNITIHVSKVVQVRSLLPTERIVFSGSFRTNASSLIPRHFINEAHAILSIRQREFEDINLHSIRYYDSLCFICLRYLLYCSYKILSAMVLGLDSQRLSRKSSGNILASIAGNI